MVSNSKIYPLFENNNLFMYSFMWEERIPIHKFNSSFNCIIIWFFKIPDKHRCWYGAGYSRLWDSIYRIRFGDDNFYLKRGGYHSQLRSYVDLKKLNQHRTLSSIWVASGTNCLKPCIVIRESITVPLKEWFSQKFKNIIFT